MSIDEFIQIDKSFNEAMFLTKIDNVFVKLLTAAMLDEMDSVKHFISDDVYNIYKNQNNEYLILGLNQTRYQLKKLYSFATSLLAYRLVFLVIYLEIHINQ